MAECWNCENCGSVLGIKNGQFLRIRYKDMQYAFQLEGLKGYTTCRTCSTINNLDLTIEEDSQKIKQS